MEITHGSSGGSGGTPGGSDTEVQFNDGGSFGGEPGFTYNKLTGFLSVTPGSIEVSDLYVEGQQKLLASSLEFNDAGNTVAYTTLSSTVQDLFVISDATIDQTALTLARNYALPDTSGTIALTSNLLSLETDGIANGDQTLLNLVGGTNVTLTDNGTGSVTIDSLASGLSQMQVMARISIGF